MKYLGILFLCLLCSCTSYNVVRVTEANDKEVNGLRFYEPTAYLSVGKNSKGETKGKVLYLPNHERQYAINGTKFLSKEKLNISVDQGWKIKTAGSTTSLVEYELPVAGHKLEAVKEVLEEGILTGFSEGIYKFVYDDSGIVLGLKKVQIIN